MDKMKNISKAEVLVLKDQVAYQEGQVVSRTLAQNAAVSVTHLIKGRRSVHMSLAEMHLLPVWMVWGKSLLMV